MKKVEIKDIQNVDTYDFYLEHTNFETIKTNYINILEKKNLM